MGEVHILMLKEFAIIHISIGKDAWQPEDHDAVHGN